MKILIANDEPFILQTMRALFEMQGDIEIVEALNGDQAVKQIQ